MYRKVTQLRLSDQYQQDADIRLKCKMLVSLAFIPAVDVIAAFETLACDIPDGDDLEPLFDYFEDTWIGQPAMRGGARRNPTFPINVWSIQDRVTEGLPRTNNSVEGWHHAFQRTVGLNHPTIYKLVEAMQLEQSYTQIAQGRLFVKKNTRYERIDQAYSTIVNGYRRREQMDYLRSIIININSN